MMPCLLRLSVLFFYAVFVIISKVYSDGRLYKYTISVKTAGSSFSHARTYNQVQVILYGNESTSPRLHIDVQYRYNSVDSVAYVSTIRLGEITCIEVFLTSTASDLDSWHLDTIKVRLDENMWNSSPNIRIYPGDSIQLKPDRVSCVAPRQGCGYQNRYSGYNCSRVCTVCQEKRQLYTYHIHTQTRGRTNNKRSIILYGTMNITPSIDIGGAYRTNSIDAFTYSSPILLGDIRCISIMLSSSTSWDYWGYEYVEVELGNKTWTYQGTTHIRLYPGDAVQINSDGDECVATTKMYRCTSTYYYSGMSCSQGPCNICQVPIISSTTSHQPVTRTTSPSTATTTTTTTTTKTTTTTTTATTPVVIKPTSTGTTKHRTTTAKETTIKSATTEKTTMMVAMSTEAKITANYDDVITTSEILTTVAHKDYGTESKNDSLPSVHGKDDRFHNGAETQTENESPTTGIAIGSVFAVLGLIAIVLVSVFVLRRRQAKAQTTTASDGDIHPVANPMYNACYNNPVDSPEIKIDHSDMTALYAQSTKQKHRNTKTGYGIGDGQFRQGDDPNDPSALYAQPVKKSVRNSKIADASGGRGEGDYNTQGEDAGVDAIYEVAGEFDTIPGDVEFETNDIYSSDSGVTMETNSLYGDTSGSVTMEDNALYGDGDNLYSFAGGATSVSPRSDNLYLVENDIYQA